MGSRKPRTADLADAKSRLRRRARGHADRVPYREAIANLSGDHMLELVPDDGETMRGLKLNVNRAAKEVNRQVGYGESDEADQARAVGLLLTLADAVLARW